MRDDTLEITFLSSDGSCDFLHDDIDTLYGVPPTPIEKLPKTCSCGKTLTYAREVAFISFTKTGSSKEVVTEEQFEAYPRGVTREA